MPRGQRSANFSDQELLDLVTTIREECPQNSHHWETITKIHLEMYPEANRTTESIKRKFTSLHRQKVPTGNPNIPDYVQIAKKAHKEIGERALVTTGVENEDQLILEQGAGGATAGAGGSSDASTNTNNGGDNAQNGAGAGNVLLSDDSDGNDELLAPVAGFRFLGGAQANGAAVNANEAPAAPPVAIVNAVRSPVAANAPVAVVANRTARDTSTVGVPRRSPTSRGSKGGMADTIMQMMMMEMQQRQAEQQLRQMEHQERMAALERDRLEQRNDANQSRMMIASAIQSVAQAFITKHTTAAAGDTPI